MRFSGVGLDPAEPDAPAIGSPEDIQRLLGPGMATLAQEQLRVLLRDRRNRVVGQRVIYQGNCYSAVVRPAEVLRPAVVVAVPNIIVVHNHPSGDATPSTNDVDVTKELAKAAELLGISLLDHVVIGGDEAVSLKDRMLESASTPGAGVLSHRHLYKRLGDFIGRRRLSIAERPHTVLRPGRLGLLLRPPLENGAAWRFPARLSSASCLCNSSLAAVNCATCPCNCVTSPISSSRSEEGKSLASHIAKV